MQLPSENAFSIWLNMFWTADSNEGTIVVEKLSLKEELRPELIVFGSTELMELSIHLCKTPDNCLLKNSEKTLCKVLPTTDLNYLFYYNI